MIISACCIIKDEEKNLPAYIEGVKDIADEIIIADTGSKDNSLKILEDLRKKYNLNLSTYNFEWTNDFAAAKNFAIEKAKGDWIIFLDADEYFDEKDRDKLKPLLKRINEDKSIIALNTPRINIDIDNHNLPTSTDTVARVFRNFENYRYNGEIHEYLDYKGDEQVRFLEANLTVLHTGYSKSLFKLKNERNKKLILLNKNKKANPLTYDFYLAIAYRMEKNYKEAEKYVKKALKVMKKADYYFLTDCYRLYITIKEEQRRPYAEIEELINDGLKFMPNHPDLLAIRMLHLIEAGKFDKVEEICRVILEKSKDKALRKKYVNKIDFELPYVYYAVGLCRLMKDDAEGALEEFLAALKSYRYRDYFLKNVLNLLNGDEKRAEDIIAEYYDEEKDAEFLSKVFGDRPKDKLYNRFCKNKS